MLAYVEGHPGLSGCEVADAIGALRSTVHYALTSLANQGQITKTGYPGAMRFHPVASVTAPQPADVSNFGISARHKLLNDCLASVLA
ncbi:hypothetical protein RHD99_11025 [Buttiauxella selenatireducens]|uniref:HTH iclR-type domain-containing protein n=1 Tax=Buttiauxella selenatireducens TaxID=3073902 RepID=A0ABY9SGR1_9ENTR|nr:hypothetical protein [Buttiauxella sp. R73]WMY76415.1 hypothetical protein RHD99_11025 [Buttiauxella sp. R73]